MNTLHCHHCHCELEYDEAIEFMGEHYCDDCLDDITVVCCRCGQRVFNGDSFVDDEDEDYAYCYDCYHRQKHIHSYHYKPEPIFYGDGSRYFGVELEVDGAGEDNNNAKAVCEIANAASSLLYCKHDGSLNDGFELVTHPMTLDFQHHNMPWQDILMKLKQMGYYSHQASTCGLHCHINRTAFGEDEAEQDEVIARILYFFEKHWEELLKFSRRTKSQLDRWAARYGYDESPKEILNCAKGGFGRYTCINLTNRNTIEFRMFRGTLKYNTLIATLQLINRICDVALFLSDDELKDMSWTTFVIGCTQPELIQYLKERRLYVNEVVESEVDL